MKLYSTAEAAAYLGLSVPAVKHHVYAAGTLKPEKVGHSLVFTKAMLDEFNEGRRGPGRPRKEEPQS